MASNDGMTAYVLSCSVYYLGTELILPLLPTEQDPKREGKRRQDLNIEKEKLEQILDDVSEHDDEGSDRSVHADILQQTQPNEDDGSG